MQFNNPRQLHQLLRIFTDILEGKKVVQAQEQLCKFRNRSHYSSLLGGIVSCSNIHNIRLLALLELKKLSFIGQSNIWWDLKQAYYSSNNTISWHIQSLCLLKQHVSYLQPFFALNFQYIGLSQAFKLLQLIYSLAQTHSNSIHMHQQAITKCLLECIAFQEDSEELQSLLGVCFILCRQLVGPADFEAQFLQKNRLVECLVPLFKGQPFNQGLYQKLKLYVKYSLKAKGQFLPTKSVLKLLTQVLPKFTIPKHFQANLFQELSTYVQTTYFDFFKSFSNGDYIVLDLGHSLQSTFLTRLLVACTGITSLIGESEVMILVSYCQSSSSEILNLVLQVFEKRKDAIFIPGFVGEEDIILTISIVRLVKLYRKVIDPTILLQFFYHLDELALREPKYCGFYYEALGYCWQEITVLPEAQLVELVCHHIRNVNHNGWGSRVQSYSAGYSILQYLIGMGVEMSGQLLEVIMESLEDIMNLIQQERICNEMVAMVVRIGSVLGMSEKLSMSMLMMISEMIIQNKLYFAESAQICYLSYRNKMNIREINKMLEQSNEYSELHNGEQEFNHRFKQLLQNNNYQLYN